MELRCGICLLRLWRESDAGAFTRHANDRDVWLNLRDRFPHPYRTADAVAYIRSVASQQPPGSFLIVVADDPAGRISLRAGEAGGRLRRGPEDPAFLIEPSDRLQARQVAGVIIAVEMNERFGGGHPDLTSAPLRHDLVVLPPDALPVLADVREQGGLLPFDH